MTVRPAACERRRQQPGRGGLAVRRRHERDVLAVRELRERVGRDRVHDASADRRALPAPGDAREPAGGATGTRRRAGSAASALMRGARTSTRRRGTGSRRSSRPRVVGVRVEHRRALRRACGSRSSGVSDRDVADAANRSTTPSGVSPARGGTSPRAAVRTTARDRATPSRHCSWSRHGARFSSRSIDRPRPASTQSDERSRAFQISPSAAARSEHAARARRTRRSASNQWNACATVTASSDASANGSASAVARERRHRRALAVRSTCHIPSTGSTATSVGAGRREQAG